MRRNVYTRLAELERVHEREELARAHAARVANGSHLEWVHRLLKIFRTEREGNESLAEALARAMRISMSELNARLRNAATGGSFWLPEELEILQRGAQRGRPAVNPNVESK
jgi:hypothetical protein